MLRDENTGYDEGENEFVENHCDLYANLFLTLIIIVLVILFLFIFEETI